MRVDAHQHFWKYDAAAYGWMTPEMDALKRDYLPGDLAPLLDAVGLDASVAVQARQDIDETRWLLELADANDFIAGVVGWIDLRSDRADAQLDELAAHPKLCGIRHVVQDEPEDEFLLREDFCAGIGRLVERGIPYDILIFTKHLPVATRFVDRFPDHPFVLDHIAKPPIARDEREPWTAGIRELARRENVLCKVSGMVTEARWNGWSPSDFSYAGRRVRRLFPALFVLIGFLAVYLALSDPELVPRWTGAMVSSLAYVANWYEIGSGVDYFDQWQNPSPLKHVWSFSIEEQFYLFAPLFIIACHKWFPKRARTALLISSVAGALASAWWMSRVHVEGAGDPSRAYYGTDTRAQAFFVGISMAVMVRMWGPVRRGLNGKLVALLAYPATIWFVWAVTNVSERDDWMFEEGGFLLAAVMAAIILHGLRQPAPWSPLHRIFESRPFIYVGRISYGLYLFHWPVYLLVTGKRVGDWFGVDPPSGYGLLVIHLTITFAVAIASFHLIEKPFTSRRFPWTGAKLDLRNGALAGSLAIIVILAGLLWANSQRPDDIEQVIIEVPVLVEAPVAGGEVVDFGETDIPGVEDETLTGETNASAAADLSVGAHARAGHRRLRFGADRLGPPRLGRGEPRSDRRVQREPSRLRGCSLRRETGQRDRHRPGGRHLFQLGRPGRPPHRGRQRSRVLAHRGGALPARHRARPHLLLGCLRSHRARGGRGLDRGGRPDLRLLRLRRIPGGDRDTHCRRCRPLLAPLAVPQPRPVARRPPGPRRPNQRHRRRSGCVSARAQRRPR